MNLKDVLNIIVPDEFGCNYEDDEVNNSMECVLNELHRIDNHNHTFNYAHGVTQFVILIDELHKVAKIPFCGYWDWNYDIDDLDFYPFECCSNYCELSVNIYEDAVEAGVEKIFAETKFFGFSKNGYPIYLQERIAETEGERRNMDRKKSDSLDFVQSKQKESRYNGWNRFKAEWLAEAIDWYGLEYIEKVLDFVKNDTRIDDLHLGNYGIAEDGRPVIFDYAGYMEG